MYACMYFSCLLCLVDIQQIGHYLKWNFPMTQPTNPVCWSVSQLVCHNFLRASSFHALLILERLFLYSDNSQSVCPLVCPSVCMSICPYVHPSVRLSLHLSDCLSNKNGSQIVVITTRPRFTM